MNLFTRLYATINSKIDAAVSHIENHDAVVAVALKDTQAAIAKAKIRHMQLHRESDALMKNIEQCKAEHKMWEQRAKKTAPTNEADALECLVRRNLYQQQAQETHALLTRNQEVERQIAGNIRTMESKLQTFQQQHHTMRSRQSTAEAMRILQDISERSPESMEAIFDKWEMKITADEYATGGITTPNYITGGITTSHMDHFENAFIRKEEKAELQAELATLLNSSNKKQA